MSNRNPDYQFVDIDAEALEAQLLAAYETITGETLQPASPDRIFIAWVTSIILQERVLTNYVGNQCIPSRAEGANLDALGELYYALTRPAAKSAVCTMRFSISEAQDFAITIPAGTRVTDASNTLIWQLPEDVIVPAGEEYADAQVQCQTAGTVGNGYVAGQINKIIDLYDYYSACSNITVSANGSDALTDDEFYDLLRASMDAFSTAGPSGAYIYHAKAVSSSIADVKALRPRTEVSETLDLYSLNGDKAAFLGSETLDVDTLKVYPHGSSTAAVETTDYTVTFADGLLMISIVSDGALASESQIDVEIIRTGAGEVVLYALMDDGSIAPSETKTAILAACNDANVRPLTDHISIADPEEVSYSIAFTYYISAESAASATEIANAVSAAVDSYKVWQSERLGRDINPSQLIGQLMQTGVKRVVLTSPTYQVLQDGSSDTVPQVAKLSGAPSIINGGVENE